MPLNSYLFQTSLCFKENNPFVSSKYRGLTTDLKEPMDQNVETKTITRRNTINIWKIWALLKTVCQPLKNSPVNLNFR